MVDTFWKRSGYPIWGVDHSDFNFLVTRHGSRWDSQRGQELQYIKLFTSPANPFSTNFAPSSPCANPNNSGTTRFVWKGLEHIQNPIIISVLYCFSGRQTTFFPTQSSTSTAILSNVWDPNVWQGIDDHIAGGVLVGQGWYLLLINPFIRLV